MALVGVTNTLPNTHMQDTLLDDSYSSTTKRQHIIHQNEKDTPNSPNHESPWKKVNARSTPKKGKPKPPPNTQTHNHESNSSDQLTPSQQNQDTTMESPGSNDDN
jgi:hypothetical protein